MVLVVSKNTYSGLMGLRRLSWIWGCSQLPSRRSSMSSTSLLLRQPRPVSLEISQYLTICRQLLFMSAVCCNQQPGQLGICSSAAGHELFCALSSTAAEL